MQIILQYRPCLGHVTAAWDTTFKEKLSANEKVLAMPMQVDKLYGSFEAGIEVLKVMINTYNTPRARSKLFNLNF